MANLIVPVAGADVEGGGEPKLRVPVVGAEATTEGQPNLRTSTAGADAETGGQPHQKVAVTGADVDTGGEPHLRAAVVGLDVLVLLPPEPFMTTLTFPTLRGRSWSTTKKQIFSTRVSLQQSGQEIRSANYPFPRWEFDLKYDWLPDTGDLRTIEGFYAQCQGSFASFLYRDPSDFEVRQGLVAATDGVTLQWPFARALVAGGLLEPVGQVDSSTVASFTSANVSGSTIALTMPAKYANNDAILMPPPATGDGPYFVVAGSGATLPAGLAAATPYWAIEISPGEIQLAKTWLAAQAGSGVTLSSAGSGSFSLTKGYSLAGDGPEAHTVPATGPYTVTVSQAATFLSDQGVTISGSPLTKVGGSPGAGQYAVNTATGVYTFNVAQASAAIEIAYAFQYPPTDYSLVLPNQVLFASAPPAGLTVTADFDFWFVCRFLDDTQAYENFMHKLWELQKCDFVAVPP